MATNTNRTARAPAGKHEWREKNPNVREGEQHRKRAGSKKRATQIEGGLKRANDTERGRAQKGGLKKGGLKQKASSTEKGRAQKGGLKRASNTEKWRATQISILVT